MKYLFALIILFVIVVKGFLTNPEVTNTITSPSPTTVDTTNTGDSTATSVDWRTKQ